MSESRKVPIQRLPSGVARLDEVLGGGWPEYSFNLIVGEPGCGKTTLAHQFMFANASAERPALYFTVLGEPTIKMLRYQQQFTFFDMAKVNGAVHFANLTDEALTQRSRQVSRRDRRQGRRASPPASSSSTRSGRSITRRWSNGRHAVSRNSCSGWP